MLTTIWVVSVPFLWYYLPILVKNSFDKCEPDVIWETCNIVDTTSKMVVCPCILLTHRIFYLLPFKLCNNQVHEAASQ